MSANESMGERLKKLRLNAKLTQQDVANLIGKSKGNVSGYEKGSFEPSANTIIELAKCFKVSTDYILTGAKIETQMNSLTEGEQDLLNLVQNLTPKEQQRVVGVVENYLGKRQPPEKSVTVPPKPSEPSAPSTLSDEEFREHIQENFSDTLELIAKLAK